MLAKQTLNHPGSEQWHEDPGDMLSLTSCNISFHSLSSPSLVCSSSSGPRFIQQISIESA
ncbi:hypothetical protein ACMD2_01994 [Ananas comosus]|uniref:Uncharacterized protein n=1 Tax=Ananas comosus TaxID=4615 RepID=A0A199W688_ANACO|nr:hypothetical protein ACMD2_01994 [Ananas comosus]